MSLNRTTASWDELGEREPLWAILNDKSRNQNNWNDDEFFETGQKEIDGILNNARKTGISIENGRALDFGCGAGRLTNALARHFSEVHGVDAATSMIRLANKYNTKPQAISFHTNRSPHLNLFPDNFLTFIYSAITLQHIEPAYSKLYIKEFMRTLKLGGILIFQITAEKIGAKQKETLTTNIKKILKKITPTFLLSMYRKLRYGRAGYIEMFGIPKKDVIALIEQSGGVVRKVEENRSAGPTWQSFTYYVSKTNKVT